MFTLGEALTKFVEMLEDNDSISITLAAPRRLPEADCDRELSDNLELINRSKEHLNYTSPYPNNTLSAEYDITEQIYLTNKTFEIDATFQHVYGHQDTRSRMG